MSQEYLGEVWFEFSYNLFTLNTVYFQVNNAAIMECTNFTDLSGKDYMDPSTDKTVKVTLIETGFH